MSLHLTQGSDSPVDFFPLSDPETIGTLVIAICASGISPTPRRTSSLWQSRCFAASGQSLPTRQRKKKRADQDGGFPLKSAPLEVF
jgi:hypothetical protein